MTTISIKNHCLKMTQSSYILTTSEFVEEIIRLQKL